MKFGMSNHQLELLNSIVVEPLKKAGAEVFIFGSRAIGKHHPNSDVDLLYSLKGQDKLPDGFISQVKERIEESRFPFTVELVMDSDLAESYRKSVESQKQKL